jgi:beta-galactosidase
MTRYPLMYFETNGGMPVQAHWRAIVPPEAVEGMSLVEVGSGCNALGYYIYHGETNPVNSRGFTGLTATLPWLSHDYQAPIREFGQIADSYRYARVFHTFLKEFGPDLAPMSVVLPDERPHEPADMNMLRFSARVDAKGTGFLFVNNYQDKLEMPDRSDVQITLRLEDETIVVPEGKPASLAGDAYCVLPFNMDLAGARLKYATAQPLCLIEDEGVLHYFFFAPKGMRPEYSLDSATVQDVKTSRGEVLEREGRTLARPGSGPDAIATFTTARGTTVKLITLTREQAERTLKAELWGRERVVIASNADVLASKDGMRLYSIGVPQMEALVFPPIKKKVTADHGELELSRTGIYSMVRVKASTCEPDWSVERHGPDKAVVRVADRSFEQAHDLFLRLNYEGDTGRAFINGRLVADHYYNGLPWEIGLKRFREKLKEQERMVFRITPRTVPLNDVIFDGIAFKTVSSNEDASISMSRFELVPEYAIWIR